MVAASEKDDRHKSAEQLRNYKTRRVQRTNPGNVSVNALASVTAGLAKEVDVVNRYAPVMYRPTATSQRPPPEESLSPNILQPRGGKGHKKKRAF